MANFVTWYAGAECHRYLRSTLIAPATAEVQLAFNAITWHWLITYTSSRIKQMLSEKVNKVDGNGSRQAYHRTEEQARRAAQQLPTLRHKSALPSALRLHLTTQRHRPDSLLAQKQTAAQVADAIAAALTSYSTTSQMNAAISTALGSYYTKTEIDTKFERVLPSWSVVSWANTMHAQHHPSAGDGRQVCQRERQEVSAKRLTAYLQRCN